jgi:PPOX class probable F420-dependent enzyme
MDRSEMLARVTAASVARLATVRADGTPHVVPLCFALDAGGETVVSIVDRKPKRSQQLRRLDNVRAQPKVSLLVDHYDDDWKRLWWVRIDGTAAVCERGPDHARAVELLAAKYAQYRVDPPSGPVLRIAPERWTGWSSTD